MTAARWVDVAWPPLVIVQSLSPVAVPLAVLAMLGAAAYGRRSGRMALAGTCAVVLTVQAAIWVPWFTGEPTRRGRELTVMTVNLYRGSADLEAVSRVAHAEDVDILAVSELSPAAAVSLRDSGLDDLLPHAVISKHGSSTTTALLSRLALVQPPNSTPDSPGPASHSKTAMLSGAAGVTVCAVHPPPPVRARIREWRLAQAEMTDWAVRTRGPIVVAGDFNASVDHPGMRQLLGTGLRDSYEVAGAGRPVTWPNGRTIPPFVQLDHVLVRGIGVQSAEDVRIPGSDHDAVVAHLVVPARR